MVTGPQPRSHCAVCGTALTLHERHAGMVCSRMQCRRHWQAEQQRLELLEWQQLRDARATEAHRPELRDVPVVALRRYETGLESVPVAQRESLRQHLMALQAESEALAEAGDGCVGEPRPDPPPVEHLLHQVCGRCGGFCCHLGNGGHAFLDARAMARAHRADPEADHATLVEAYLDAIPAIHQAGSCAYHGPQGCVLPRHRRGDVCNTWECTGLIEARQYAETTGGTAVFVVRRRAHQDYDADFLPALDKPRFEGH